MSAVEVQQPIYAVLCDHGACRARHEPKGRWDRRSVHRARRDADSNGWQCRPARGRGSRSAPDLCPAHRRDQDGAQ